MELLLSRIMWWRKEVLINPSVFTYIMIIVFKSKYKGEKKLKRDSVFPWAHSTAPIILSSQSWEAKKKEEEELILVILEGWDFLQYFCKLFTWNFSQVSFAVVMGIIKLWLMFMSTYLFPWGLCPSSLFFITSERNSLSLRTLFH
jgi:hypothetical protein